MDPKKLNFVKTLFRKAAIQVATSASLAAIDQATRVMVNKYFKRQVRIQDDEKNAR